MSIDTDLATLTACGITVPATAQHWLAVRDALAADHEAHTIEDPRETALPDLTPESVTDVLDRLTRQQVDTTIRHRITAELVTACSQRVTAALRAEADNLITAARPGFDKAAAKLASAAGVFAPDDEPEAVLSRGPKGATAWATVNEQSAKLEAYLDLWATVYGTRRHVDAVVQTYDGDHWRRVDAQEAFGAPTRWHALTAAGYTLRLNTQAEAEALVQATPAKELRPQRVKRGGIIGTELVRA